MLTHLGAGVATALWLMAAGAVACEFPSFGQTTLEIRNDRLVALRGGQVVGRASLPVNDRDWSCRRISAFPEVGEVYVEWDHGISGEGITFHRISLIAFHAGEDLTRIRQWTLYQGYRDGDEALTQTDRTYRLIPTGYGVRVVLISR